MHGVHIHSLRGTMKLSKIQWPWLVRCQNQYDEVDKILHEKSSLKSQEIHEVFKNKMHFTFMKYILHVIINNENQIWVLRFQNIVSLKYR